MAFRSTAVGYVRVSTDKQEISPEAQKDIIIRWAAENDIKLLKIFSDVCSGATPWVERQGLVEAVDLVKREKAAWLVTAKADRLSRDLYDQLHLQRELEAHDALPVSCTETPEETTTPEKELMRQMLGSFAQFERAMIRGRIKTALAMRQKQGVKLGAAGLEGTELGRCIVQAMWWLHDQGLGARAIADELNRRGIVGPRGGEQHFRNVQRVLKRGRPTEIPRAWQGIGPSTWNKFNVKRRSKSTAGSRANSNPAGRPEEGGGSAAPDQECDT